MRLCEVSVEPKISDKTYRFILNTLKSRQDSRAINKVAAMWKEGERALFKYHKTLADIGHDDLASMEKRGVDLGLE